LPWSGADTATKASAFALLMHSCCSNSGEVPQKFGLPEVLEAPPISGCPVAPRENVVEIEMQLGEDPNAGAAVAVEWNDRLDTDLEIASHPDHTGIDRPGRHKTVADIVGCPPNPWPKE
jgi:hypothetical protein